jgi:hypothetical protein
MFEVSVIWTRTPNSTIVSIYNPRHRQSHFEFAALISLKIAERECNDYDEGDYYLIEVLFSDVAAFHMPEGLIEIIYPK